MEDNKTQTVLLTTVDNPFSPFTQFEDWYNYDINNGYFTCERLARITICSPLLTDEENNSSLFDAMEEMIKVGAYNKNGNVVEYKKVFK